MATCAPLLAISLRRGTYTRNALAVAYAMRPSRVWFVSSGLARGGRLWRADANTAVVIGPLLLLADDHRAAAPIVAPLGALLLNGSHTPAGGGRVAVAHDRGRGTPAIVRGHLPTAGGTLETDLVTDLALARAAGALPPGVRVLVIAVGLTAAIVLALVAELETLTLFTDGLRLPCLIR